MMFPLARTLLAVAVAAALPVLAAQSQPAPQGNSPVVQDRWPEPPRPPQAEPAPAPAPRPARTAQPKPARPAQPNLDQPDLDQPAAAAPASKPQPRAPANVIVCGGPFAKDSGHLKLALRFDSRNVTYGQVDGPNGTKINASILYPNDPKRRLEVLWNNEAARSDLSVIAINGKSQWIAPKGIRLGLAVAAIENLNKRPFKLTGLAKDGSATVAGWEGGALASLAGGCKVGLRLFADAKSDATALDALPADKEFMSNDPAVRALKPTVGEILIGY